MLLSGNHAVSWGARLARPQFVACYPITPQTPILELLTEFQMNGEVDAEILTPESEHSAMAACIGASLTGVRVFTATSCQGLLLMHEMLHYAAGLRAPIVMFNVNRTVASPWGFWPDQTDSVSQRDTGWIQFYSESAQESLDSVLQAFRIAERVSVPVLVNQDAFYISHALEPVDVPDQALADRYLPAFEPERFLDPERGESVGNVVSQEMYGRHRQDMGQAMDRTLAVAQESDTAWKALTGRGYGIVEPYRCDDAELVIVSMGSMCGTARDAVDDIRAAGRAAGLLKVRLFRPFPAEAVRGALSGVPDVLVLDRNFSPGSGGVLHQELKSALFGMNDVPRVHGCLAGVGGTNVSPRTIRKLAENVGSTEPRIHPLWTG
ncbi:MAG TPA: pyruvate ferredoxin oxidoreductase [Woeseiaceae bacterium]|nr:pyruvate ferredoxin oxidoreductase [Woeseiaceae bacterium]